MLVPEQMTKKSAKLEMLRRSRTLMSRACLASAALTTVCQERSGSAGEGAAFLLRLGAAGRAWAKPGFESLTRAALAAAEPAVFLADLDPAAFFVVVFRVAIKRTPYIETATPYDPFLHQDGTGLLA